MSRGSARAHPAHRHMILPAVLFALSAAMVFGLNMHIQNKGLDDTDELTGAFVSVAAMAAVFWALSPLFVDFAWFRAHALWYFAASGLVIPALGQRLQIASIRLVGPAISSAINGFLPVFAILPAVLVLGETFGLQATLGLTIMIGGVLFTALYKGKIKRGWPLWALLIPLTASFARGLSPVVNKFGYAEVDSPFFATLIMSTVSTVVLILALAFRRTPARTPAGRKGVLWFALSGLLNGLGILCVNLAVSRGDVSIVTPLMMASPVFALGFGAYVFKREVIGLNHVVLVAAIVTGSVLIVTR
ncbi:MAG: EamA family transporter [Burkholderiaceae bacterium]